MKRFTKKYRKEEEALLNEINRTKMALETAYSNFENVIDPDLIDSCIYEVNAVQKRYRFLLRQVKSLDQKYYAV